MEVYFGFPSPSNYRADDCEPFPATYWNNRNLAENEEVTTNEEQDLTQYDMQNEKETDEEEEETWFQHAKVVVNNWFHNNDTSERNAESSSWFADMRIAPELKEDEILEVLDL